MTDCSDAPRRVSDREVPMAITGYFMPTHAPNAPVLIGMPGTDDLFILVFSTMEKLAQTMAAFEIEYERVSIVDSGGELVDEITEMNASGGRPYRIRIAVDPYKNELGHVRFLEPLA